VSHDIKPYKIDRYGSFTYITKLIVDIKKMLPNLR